MRICLGAVLTCAIVTVSITPCDASSSDGWTYRTGGWVMAPLGTPQATEVNVAYGEPFLVRTFASQESVRIDAARQVPIAERGLKTPSSLLVQKGEVLHRVITSEASRKIYCGGGVGYRTRSFFVPEKRVCFADNNSDGMFDSVMLGAIFAEGSRPMMDFGLIGAAMQSLIDNGNFIPVVLEEAPGQSLAIPYTNSVQRWVQFELGLSAVRKGNSVYIGISQSGSNVKSKPFAVFSIESSIILQKYPYVRHSKLKDLSKTEVDKVVVVAGLRILITSISADTLHVKYLGAAAGDPAIAVSYSGTLPNRIAD